MVFEWDGDEAPLLGGGVRRKDLAVPRGRRRRMVEATVKAWSWTLQGATARQYLAASVGEYSLK